MPLTPFDHRKTLQPQPQAHISPPHRVDTAAGLHLPPCKADGMRALSRRRAPAQAPRPALIATPVPFPQLVVVRSQKAPIRAVAVGMLHVRRAIPMPCWVPWGDIRRCAVSEDLGGLPPPSSTPTEDRARCRRGPASDVAIPSPSIPNATLSHGRACGVYNRSVCAHLSRNKSTQVSSRGPPRGAAPASLVSRRRRDVSLGAQEPQPERAGPHRLVEAGDVQGSSLNTRARRGETTRNDVDEVDGRRRSQPIGHVLGQSGGATAEASHNDKRIHRGINCQRAQRLSTRRT